MKIYLAGKITKHGWRGSLVDGIHDINSADEWSETFTLPMYGGNVYTGPFFIRCHHGCGHLYSGHGAKSGCAEVTRAEVHQKAHMGIRNADVVIAYAGLD
jgi:hypothetical protein